MKPIQPSKQTKNLVMTCAKLMEDLVGKEKFEETYKQIKQEREDFENAQHMAEILTGQDKNDDIMLDKLKNIFTPILIEDIDTNNFIYPPVHNPNIPIGLYDSISNVTSKKNNKK